MRRLLFLFFLTVFYKAGFAQTVEFYFPTLAGEEYLIYLNKGTQNDTVQKGVIAEGGRFTFTLPEENRDYAGIVNFVFSAGKQGFILNNETISIKAANPYENSLVFENSEENDFLFKRMNEFKEVLQKTNAVYRIKEIFDENNPLYQAAEHEIAQLETIYQTHRNELANSNLYAARYIELFHFLNGFISGIAMSEQEKQIDAARFITGYLDMDVLYTSGFWNYVISSAFELFPDKALFGQAMVKNLERTRSPKVFDALANDLVTICEQFDWPEAEDFIISYLVSSGRIQNATGKLWAAMEMDKVKAGNKAIPIQGIKNLSNTLLIFYESDCGSCEEQLNELVTHYSTLKEKKMQIVSIAADRDEQIFEKRAATFPWTDKLCDYKGFTGENFINYRIIGTPTIFIIDKKGYITGRYARLQETGLINELK